MVKTSVLGVMKAAATSTSTTAILRVRCRNSEFRLQHTDTCEEIGHDGNLEDQSHHEHQTDKSADVRRQEYLVDHLGRHLICAKKIESQRENEPVSQSHAKEKLGKESRDDYYGGLALIAVEGNLCYLRNLFIVMAY